MDLISYINRQSKFSKAVFGNGYNVIGLVNHIRNELEEIECNPTDVYEWIDVVILALDGAWRAGHSAEDICNALERKLALNMKREWKEPDENGVIEHIRRGNE